MALDNLLNDCIESLNKTYNQTYQGKGAHTNTQIEPNLTALVDACFKKFSAWKDSGLQMFKKNETKTIDGYIEHLNHDKTSHYHARMLFQILFAVQQLEKSQDGSKIFPEFTEVRLNKFISTVQQCNKNIIPSVPPKAEDQYQEFKTAIAQVEKSAKQAVIDKTMHVINTGYPITDSLATEFYKATLGTGESPGKKIAEEFMKNTAPTLSIDQLTELTRGVMRAQQKDQIVSATEPFLRKTGVITDKLYLQCAKQLNYSPASDQVAPPQMVALNREVLIGKGFDNNRDSNDSESVINAAVEINFKLEGNPKPVGHQKIMQEVKKILPPPLPASYIEETKRRNSDPAPISAPPIPPRPRPRSGN